MSGCRACAGRVRALTLVAESGGPGGRVSDTIFHGKTPPGGGLKALYERHWGELCQYISKAFGAGPPDPEDVAQTAFMKYASLDRPADIRNPRAFLFTAARNTVVDYKRREATRQAHARNARHGAGHDAVDDRSPEHALLEKERLRIVQTVIATLSETERHVFLLSVLDGCGYAEIARRTGVPRSSVRRYVVKGLAACDQALAAAAATGQDGDPT